MNIDKMMNQIAALEFIRDFCEEQLYTDACIKSDDEIKYLIARVAFEAESLFDNSKTKH